MRFNSEDDFLIERILSDVKWKKKRIMPIDEHLRLEFNFSFHWLNEFLRNSDPISFLWGFHLGIVQKLSYFVVCYIEVIKKRFLKKIENYFFQL